MPDATPLKRRSGLLALFFGTRRGALADFSQQLPTTRRGHHARQVKLKLALRACATCISIFPHCPVMRLTFNMAHIYG
jgi:hypothetical protein